MNGGKDFDFLECARRGFKISFHVAPSQTVLMDNKTFILIEQCDHPNVEDGVYSHSRTLGFFFSEEDAIALCDLKLNQLVETVNAKK